MRMHNHWSIVNSCNIEVTKYLTVRLVAVWPVGAMKRGTVISNDAVALSMQAWGYSHDALLM